MASSSEKDRESILSIDLHEALRLDDIRLFETGCRDDRGFDDEAAQASQESLKDKSVKTPEEEQNWEISVRIRGAKMECRARVMVLHRNFRYLVDAVAVYKGSTRLREVEHDKIVEFVESEALSTLYPYMRSEVHQMVPKIRGSSKLLTELTADGIRRSLRDSATGNSAEPVDTTEESENE